MSDNLLTVTRQQLAQFIKDPRTLRAFEQAVKQSNTLLPAEVVAIYQRIDEAVVEGQLATNKSNEALGILESLARSLEVLSLAPPAVLQDDDPAEFSSVPTPLPDDLTPPVVQPLLYGHPEVTQPSSPNATAFNTTVVALVDGVINNVWLLLTPTGAFAAGTITMPPVATCTDRLTVAVTCTQAVTTLTVAGNGASVQGAPTMLATNSTFSMRFDAATSTWYRFQ
jgi:hypothetical protein